MRLFVVTKETRLEDQDYYGVHLNAAGGPFPCKVQYTFELVHHGWNPESALQCTGEFTFTEAQAWGCPRLISKARLASPDNNPYVKDGYVTFTCTFSSI
jgi:hypothetical protein